MNIAFDLDDILSSFNLIFHKWHNVHYGTKVKMNDITTFFMTQVYGITIEQAVERIFEFYHTEECKNLPVEKDALTVTRALKEKGHNLYVVTSRDTEIEAMTKDWINKNFPGIFNEVILTKQFARGNAYNTTVTKSQICKQIDANILVEDAPIYAEEAANAGINVAFIEKPWNKTYKIRNNKITKLKKINLLENYLINLIGAEY